MPLLEVDLSRHRLRLAVVKRPAEVREEWHDEMDVLDPYAESKLFDCFWAAVAALTIAATLIWFFVFTDRAWSQEAQIGDFGVGHAQWHHWYQSGENGGPIMRPYQPTISCCNGDCRPTLARFRDGQWLALIDGQYDPVPESRVKRNATSPNSGAHVCAPRRTSTEPVIPYCFVPPEGGT